MKSYKNIYKEIYNLKNLESAYGKAKIGKGDKEYVKDFEENLDKELLKLKNELEDFTYKPHELNRFIVRDPKTRTIHSSAFRDRVVYHALVNIIEPIFEKIFINDSYANRKSKGTHKAVLRFDKFQRKVTNNGKLVNNPISNNMVLGFVLKADIKKYFETVSHEILLSIIQKKIKDNNVIWLIKRILNNYEMQKPGTGMPLGNLTSQFFANVYLNELDYFVKHGLKVRYYIRYVDDFIILHKNKRILEYYQEKINEYLINNLRLQLHPDKSKIMPLRDGITFLGYRIFYHYKLLRKSNKRKFYKNLKWKVELYQEGFITYEELFACFKGWVGYSIWADTYKIRKNVLANMTNIRTNKIKAYNI